MISLSGWSWLPLPPWNPKSVSLRDFPFGLLLAAVAALEPKLVSLHVPFWAALGCFLATAPALEPKACLPSYSLLGCSWLPLRPWNPSLSPFMISLSGLLLAASWLPLPPWNPKPVSKPLGPSPHDEDECRVRCYGMVLRPAVALAYCTRASRSQFRASPSELICYRVVPGDER